MGAEADFRQPRLIRGLATMKTGRDHLEELRDEGAYLTLALGIHRNMSPKLEPSPQRTTIGHLWPLLFTLCCRRSALDIGSSE